MLERADRPQGRSDHELVRALRRGDERAFEELYSRYQRRIAAYVSGMVKDHGRAEDITQEIFVSALRRMGQTERPIAFKPWIYEIAKNACIDAHRRRLRAEEVSLDADDRLTPSDHGRLVATDPEPGAALDTKQDLDRLCGAFGGLTENHHRILVMRELEGLSYADIGERMGMSRPAVESTLFRARKRLGEEYDELASGARCLRIQALIADAATRLGKREQRKLTRHVSHCQPCRRVAAGAGLEIAIPARSRVAGKIAAWLPIPAFLRMRRGGGDAPATGGSGHGGWLAHTPALADSIGAGWGKAAAGLAALLVAGAGAGVTTTLDRDQRDARGAGQQPAAEQTVARDGASAATPVAAGERAGAGGRLTTGAVGRRAGGRREQAASESVPGDGRAGTPSRRVTPTVGGSPGSNPGAADQGGGGGGGSGDDGGKPAASDRPGSTPKLPSATPPAVKLPAGGGEPVQDTLNNVDQTIQHAGQNVQNTVNNTTQNVQGVLDDPGNLVPNVKNTAGDAVQDVGTTVDGALDDVTETVGGLLKP